jgi:Holliday junction DNA helicase RuvB
MAATRLTTAEKMPEDGQELKLRPQAFAEFTGQTQSIENLKIFVSAAKVRGEALDHVLFYGPPGLGKTTLAQIVASEMGVGFRATSGPLLMKAGDLAAILTGLQPRDVLFIDEIHRMNAAVEEVLYPAMEDGKLDLIIGEGPAARTVRIDLPPFTLVGATTRLGLLSNPLRDRFGIPLRLQFYSPEELEKVLTRASGILNIELDRQGSEEIARRSRGTPRIAVRLLRRVRDFAQAAEKGKIDRKLADDSLKRLEVDALGLDSADRRYLSFIAEHYAGGPVGIETIAAGLSEQRDSLEETIEPYLLQKGFLARTPRGRVLTETAYKHLGLAAPKRPDLLQAALFENPDDDGR